MNAYAIATISCLLVALVSTPGCSKKKKGRDPVQLAAFVYEADAKFPANGSAGIEAFEKLVGKKLASVMWYVTWDDAFPTEDVEVVRNHGATPHVTWELFWPSKDSNNTRTLEPSETGFDDVLEGAYDEYIDRFAKDGAEWGGDVYIRFLHEFNGNWYIWSGNKNGRENGGPEKVAKVWRYVVDRCRAQGAENFIWVWCPHGPSIDVSTESWNELKAYWPGEDYVDWHAIDAYNWFPKDPWGGERPYRDFEGMFQPTYDECLALAEKPIMIGETGTGEFQRGEIDKARWITEMFDQFEKYPMIKMLVWFHINKERDWRINSSPESLEAFKKAAGGEGVSSKPQTYMGESESAS